MKYYTDPIGRNQLANTRNPYQSDAVKALCICSAGLLRSTTIAAYLSKKFGHNVRNCGTSQEYALIPLSAPLMFWAEEVHVVDEQYQFVVEAYEQLAKEHPYMDMPEIYSLPIPDQYAALSDELFEVIDGIYTDMGYTGE